MNSANLIAGSSANTLDPGRESQAVTSRVRRTEEIALRPDYTAGVTARTDEELLQAARAGDDAALEALLTRHERQIFRFGLRMCGNEEDARDVLQETLLAAFKGMHQFRGDAQLSTWLYQVARSFCTKARRRGAGEPSRHESIEGADAREVSVPASGPDDRAHAREMARVLQEALLALPESQREVVLLRDVEGLSAEEAARVVGIEVPALKSRLHRARLAMQERIATLLGGDPVESAGVSRAGARAAHPRRGRSRPGGLCTHRGAPGALHALRARVRGAEAVGLDVPLAPRGRRAGRGAVAGAQRAPGRRARLSRRSNPSTRSWLSPVRRELWWTSSAAQGAACSPGSTSRGRSVHGCALCGAAVPEEGAPQPVSPVALREAIHAAPVAAPGRVLGARLRILPRLLGGDRRGRAPARRGRRRAPGRRGGAPRGR